MNIHRTPSSSNRIYISTDIVKCSLYYNYTKKNLYCIYIVYGTSYSFYIYCPRDERKQLIDRWVKHRGNNVIFDERILFEIELLNLYVISVTRQARSFTEGIVRCSFFFFKSLHQQSLTIFFFLVFISSLSHFVCFMFIRVFLFFFIIFFYYHYFFFFVNFYIIVNLGNNGDNRCR